MVHPTTTVFEVLNLTGAFICVKHIDARGVSVKDRVKTALKNKLLTLEHHDLAADDTLGVLPEKGELDGFLVVRVGLERFEVDFEQVAVRLLFLEPAVDLQRVHAECVGHP